MATVKKPIICPKCDKKIRDVEVLETGGTDFSLETTCNRCHTRYKIHVKNFSYTIQEK